MGMEKQMWTHLSPVQRVVTVIVFSSYVGMMAVAVGIDHAPAGRSKMYGFVAACLFALVPLLTLWLGMSTAAIEATDRIPWRPSPSTDETRGLGLSPTSTPIPQGGEGDPSNRVSTRLGMFNAFYSVFLMNDVWIGWPRALRVVLLVGNLAVAAYLIFGVGRRTSSRTPELE